MSDINKQLLGEINLCPHCKYKLSSIPSRKKKCVFCGQFIYVRTRPQDKKKVLVTENEAKRIDIQWQEQYQASEDEKLLDIPEFSKVKKELTKSFGKEASMNDIKWFVYNQRDLKYLKNNDWNSYRGNILDKAKLLILEKRYKQALPLLFQICYLDIVNSNYDVKDDNFDKMHKIKNEFINNSFAPGIISMIEDIIEKDNLNSIVNVKNIFLESIKNIFEFKLNINITKEKFWTELTKYIEKRDVIRSIDPNDTLNIINEINKKIEKDFFSEASELIYKLKNPFYSKVKNNINLNLIKENLKNWLYLDDFKVYQASESLLTTLIKKDYNSIKDISQKFIINILEHNNQKLNWTTVSQFYNVDKSFTISLIPKLIDILKNNPEWNVRRVCSHNIGEIGSEDINLIKEAIPIMLNYVTKPYKIDINDESNFKLILNDPSKNFDLDQIKWLRDAYIDSLKLIIIKNKSYMIRYKPIFEKIALKDKYESSMFKAKQVLEEFEK